jgi:hypothetical protein
MSDDGMLLLLMYDSPLSISTKLKGIDENPRYP